MKEDLNCDEETGLCSPAPLAYQQHGASNTSKGVEVIYIGDPMCSWCWGISKHLFKLRAYQKATQGTFKIVVGGLRPGGGDAWDDKFKGYLRHHWDQVNKTSGQPFGSKLLDRDHFNYDTEPSVSGHSDGTPPF
ncbi:MAG: hypothetical protein AAF039_16765 [Bacteroidota bacterium]